MNKENSTPEHAVTLFTTCKPFVGETAIFQENAIANWCEQYSNIIVFGNDHGVAKIAKKYDLIHVPDIKVDEDGLPYLDSMFDAAQQMATTPFIAYINSDIILSSDFSCVVSTVIEKADSDFLIVSRRKNIPITFSTLNNESRTLFDDTLQNYATWDRANAIDLFMFNKELYSNLPPFVLGRMTWDNWLLWKARDQGAQVIDVSLDACLYHPIHGYSSSGVDRTKVVFGLSAQNNKLLAACFGLNIEQAATHYFERGKLFSTEENRQYVSQKCEVDVEKELLSGLKYLKDGIHHRPQQQTIDCLKTVLFRHNQFVPMGKDSGKEDFTELENILLNSEGNVAAALEDWMSKSYIDKINQAQRQGRKIYIWGAGEYGRRLLSCLKRADLSIEGILDSNLDLVGNGFDDSEIANYEEIFTSQTELKPFILIASMYFVEIGAFLEQHSLAPDADFIA